MNKNFQMIIDYLEEKGMEYNYDPITKHINFVIAENSSGEKLYEDISIYKSIFRAYICIHINLKDIKLDENTKNRLCEYIHRVNLGMVCGNFEYDIDANNILFKNIFEIELSSNPDYIAKNIILPVTMINNYSKVVFVIINSNILPKDIVNEIEKND